MSAGAPPIDLLSGDFYGAGARQAYAWMRRSSPVHFDHNSGLWGVATYDSVLAAGRDPAVFSNAGGSRPDTGPLPWMIDMDGSAHRQRRRLVSGGFTPGRVRASEGRVGEICDGLIDRVCEQGRCDAVRDLAAPLPMVVIGDMLGVPAEDHGDLLRWSHDLIASMESSERIEAAAVAFTEYSDYARAMIADRRERPTDDLVSVLVHAEVDDGRLDEDEIVFETLLLLVGGDETTRHVISGGLEQLLLHPGEKGKVLDGSVPVAVAVEEMLRWVSPIKNMCRTVTDDVELEGRHLRAGDKVLLLYESANFDDTHFDAPEQFTVDRVPNDHLAFGFGAHYCLGASLARLELQVMFDRILRRLPDLELAVDGPVPHPLTGIAELPVTFTPTGRRPLN